LSSLRRIVQKFIIYFRSYSGINNIWGYGSTTAVYIVLQVLTRLLLSMYVVMLVNISFDVVELLMENNVGMHYVRFLHANICSVVFIVLLIHASKGFWFRSYVKGNLWKSRSLLLVLVMRAAFLRYVLPWGNISLWGATVITNLLSVLPKGDLILLNVWARFTICNATLRRIFSLHFLVPLLVIGVILVHLILLHEYTSSSSNTVNLNIIEFSLLLNKDVMLWIVWMLWLGMIIVLPQFFIDADNWREANFLVTPDHIKPEWYFLFAYAILRCIPNKAIRVLGLVRSLVVVILIRFMNFVNFVTIFLVSFWILTWLRRLEVNEHYTLRSQYISMIYFIIIL
jgi:ubiquinol-cytochrome c reductase cytochrome b subunit